MLCLVNAPANGDTAPMKEKEISECRTRMMNVLSRSGLEVDRRDRRGRDDAGALQSALSGTGGAI